MARAPSKQCPSSVSCYYCGRGKRPAAESGLYPLSQLQAHSSTPGSKDAGVGTLPTAVPTPLVAASAPGRLEDGRRGEGTSRLFSTWVSVTSAAAGDHTAGL